MESDTQSASSSQDPQQILFIDTESAAHRRKYVNYFLRRTNNCECTCGVCGCCVSDYDFFSTVQDHLDTGDGCVCVICTYYRNNLTRYNRPLFRYNEDDRISMMRR